jgi:signal transduction histidine kinase
LEESILIALSSVEKKEIQLRKNFLTTPPVSVDYNQMKQVVVNILVNALQALKDHGSIEISCGPSSSFQRNAAYGNAKFSDMNLGRQLFMSSYAWVKVSDNGQGIPEDVLSKIFYPFFTTKEKGSGIGLAIAQKIVESHHGSIDVESEPGVGTTFTLKLPL